MASQEQVRANRRNGRLGGPRTPEGKAVSRLNARKHGIFASALTPMDHEELRGVHDRCRAELQPVGFLEEAIVDKIAAVYLSLQRCALAHAEYHLLTWKQHPCQSEWPRRHPDDRFDLNYFETTVVLVQRYDTTLTNQFLKLIHELQSLQERRSREASAPPSSGPRGDACAGKVARPPLGGYAASQGSPAVGASGETGNVRTRAVAAIPHTGSSVAGGLPRRGAESHPAAAVSRHGDSVPGDGRAVLQNELAPRTAPSRERPSGRPRDLGPATTQASSAPGAALRNEPNSPQPIPVQADTDGATDAGPTGSPPPNSAWRDPFEPHPRLPYWHRRGCGSDTPGPRDR